MLGRRPKTGHIENVASPAASALDVALASTSSTVVIVGGDTQQGRNDLIVGLSEFRHGGNERSRGRAADSGNPCNCSG